MFTINGHDLTGAHRDQGIDPAQKTALQLIRAQPRKHLTQGVMRGDSMGQLQKLFQIIELGLTKRLDFGPAIGATDHPQYRQYQHIAEFMAAISIINTRIINFFKML